MKHALSDASRKDRLIERAVCQARCRGKTGKGKISSKAFASILAHPGEPIFPETGVAGIEGQISAILHQSDLRSPKTPGSMQTRVEFPTAACDCVRVERRNRVAVQDTCTAVQHLTKAFSLSKPAEPPLITK